MSEKINEALWKAFVKKQKLAVELDDKELLKALARWDRTDAAKPEARLEALKYLIKEIPKQVVALAKSKKQLGDKAFGLVKDELYGLLEEAEAQQKKTQDALDTEDDDEDTQPGSLVDPRRLHKQLTLCRHDPERRMKFAFVDGRDKQPAMLVLHPRMSARALFGKLQAASGVKTGAFGSAWVDGTSLMLQLDKPLSGLVRKVRVPVKTCGFKIAKAVLWNEDGTVFEQDETGEERTGEGRGDAAASDAPPEADAAPTAAPPLPSVVYERRLAALQPRVRKALEDGSPDATKHRRLLEFAVGKAQDVNYLAALAALKQLEQLLDDPTPAASNPGDVDPGTAFKARMGALIPQIKDAQTARRAGWEDIRLKVGEAGLRAGKGDFEGAHRLLDEAEELLLATAAPRARTGTPPGTPEAGTPTTGRVGMEVFRQELRTLRVQAIDGMTELIERLNADPHPQAASIAQIVTQLARQMPSEMEDMLLRMDEAMRDNDASAVALHRASVRKGATQWLAFLQDNQEPIQGCEANPWGIQIRIDKPLRASLRAILKTAQ